MKENNNQEKTAYKYAQIQTDLTVKILDGRLKPHQRIPSLNEITAHYNVSKITARRVLNDLVAEGLVYAIRGKGSFVADTTSYPSKTDGVKFSRNIGVVFEHAYGAFMHELIKGIDEEAYELGVHITLCLSNDSYEREAEVLKRLVQQGKKRILLFMVVSDHEETVNKNISFYLNLQEQGIRLLLIDCYIPHVSIPSISWDDYGGMKNLVEYAASHGCRDIAYFTRINNAITNRKRLEGFKDGILEHQLPYSPQRVLRIPRTGEMSLIHNSRQVALDLFSQNQKLDAILCSDEEIAAGIFDAMDRSPTVDPNKILVGGFGGLKNIHLVRDHPYVLLEQDTYELGRQAAKIILDDADLRSESDGSVFRKVLPVPLRIPQKAFSRRVSETAD